MTHRYVLIYDGVCRLCDGVVRFILTRDKSAVFRFCALQSRAAEPLLSKAGLTRAEALKSFILLDSEGPRVLRRSDAAIAIAQALPSPWPILSAVASCVPSLLRNAVYDCVATRRYAIFGKTDEDECLAPTRHVLARFLDADEIVASLRKKDK